MEISHLRYVAEVAKTGSITQASVNLGMNQPNLSKAIKSLEAELGITLFKRSSKGVFLTEEGKAFVETAQEILNRLNLLESRYKASAKVRRALGVSAPRTGYIFSAFTSFVRELSGTPDFRFDLCETGNGQAIRNVSSMKHTIGILRFPENQEGHFLRQMKDANLKGDLLLQSQRRLVLPASGSKAQTPLLTASDLEAMVEIILAECDGGTFDPEPQPAAPIGERRRTVTVQDQGSQLALLSGCPNGYIWTSVLPRETLERYDLIQKESDICSIIYKDVLIQQKKHIMDETELCFLKHLYFQRDLMEIK